jgi:Uma2 family endonuclease
LQGKRGILLARDPDASFGIDVVSVSADVMARQSGDSTMIEGIPTLVVEILSPSDTLEDVNEKIEASPTTRVPLVWIIDPHGKTVTMHRPSAEPQLLKLRDAIPAEPHLPGFRVQLRSLFE